MTREQYIRSLEREVQRLNQRIDLKILRGEAYGALSRRHRLLLREIHKHTGKSFLYRLFPFFLQF